MSKTKKIISLLLTVVLVMTMATVAIVSSSALEEGEFHVVAGAAELCGSAWDPADTANQMDWNADKGIYEKIYTNVAAGTYEFKVTTNGGWDNGDYNLVGDAMYGGPNAVANVEADGSTVIIGFDGFKALLEITAGSGDPIVTDPVVTDPVVTDPVVTDPVVDGETITIYFENNWMWPEVSIYYWGGASGENAAWPGAAMTEIVGKNGDGTYDIYKMEVPADITGIVFSGEGGYGRDQSADVTDIQDGLVYYMTWDEATQTKPCGSYEYAPVDTEPVVTDPVVTDPVVTDPVVTDPVVTDPVVDETGVSINGTVYPVSVGDTITYTAKVKADELFEDIQAIVKYDADKLELAETKSTEACPGVANGLIFNAKNAGVVKFNAVYIEGYDFTEEDVLVTLTFTVKDNALSEIDLTIEEMTIVETGESYFTNGEASKTEGITVTETLDGGTEPTDPIVTDPIVTDPIVTDPIVTDPIVTDPIVTDPIVTDPIVTDPVVDDNKGVKVNDDVYAVSVGDEITYVVYLEAEELFEDVQAIITYDADKLELAETKSTEACPGLASGLVFNAKNPGEVKFNAVYLDGYNFTEEGIFVTLTFNVKDNALSEIDLLIEEMTILTGESYFTDGEPSKTEGITVREVLEVPQQPTTDPIVTDPIVTDPIVTDPIVTDPIVTDPIVTDPIVTDPIVTDPIVTDPVVTDPVVTDPVVTDPVVTDPSTTTPDATSATGTNATEAPNAPGTGATAYIYVALAILAMAAAAVVVLRKKANG